MIHKKSIVSALGDSKLPLAERIADALTANDQVKCYFALPQTAKANAESPRLPTPDLHVERLAERAERKDLDEVAAGTGPNPTLGRSAHRGAIQPTSEVWNQVPKARVPTCSYAGLEID